MEKPGLEVGDLAYFYDESNKKIRLFHIRSRKYSKLIGFTNYCWNYSGYLHEPSNAQGESQIRFCTTLNNCLEDLLLPII